jgi:nucleotide-binding universal stress UspA family protein
VIKFSKIIAPTDLSKLSRVGVRRALEMGEADGAEVILYCVISTADDWLANDPKFNPAAALIPKHEKLLADFVKEHCGDFSEKVKIREIVEIGVPDKKIVEKAEAEEADLIVISTHGRTGLDHMLVGSVTERVIARATCPVLSMRPPK